MPNNIDTLKTLGNIEVYITNTINQCFSPITVSKLISYDCKQNAFVGAFMGSNNVAYTFFISQTDGAPLIKPYASN